MLTFDSSILQVQNIAKDSTVGSLQFIKDNLNLGYKYIISELGRTVTEKTKTTATVATQQYYQMPKDFIFPKSLTVTIGTLKYPVEFEESQQNWDMLNSYPQTTNIPQRAFVRRSFGINTIEIGLWPVPASSSNTITLVYEAIGKDLTQVAYNTGTVTCTNGSPTVTGSGTTFLASMINRFFQTTDANGDMQYYKITGYTSPTSITIENGYEGATAAGLAYQVAEVFNLPEEMQMLPVYYALQMYYAIKGDDNKEIKNRTLFEDGITKAKERYANKGKSNVIRKNYYRFGYSYPAHFPNFFQ
jgi:hypothetical protein